MAEVKDLVIILLDDWFRKPKRSLENWINNNLEGGLKENGLFSTARNVINYYNAISW